MRRYRANGPYHSSAMRGEPTVIEDKVGLYIRYDDHLKEITAAEQRGREQDRGVCAWKENDEGTWETDCGNGFEFISDGPKDNRFSFCPYCGGRLQIADAIRIMEDE